MKGVLSKNYIPVIVSLLLVTIITYNVWSYYQVREGAGLMSAALGNAPPSRVQVAMGQGGASPGMALGIAVAGAALNAYEKNQQKKEGNPPPPPPPPPAQRANPPPPPLSPPGRQTAE